MYTPQQFGLPPDHMELRLYQLESILWSLGINGTGILEAPTGSGKTALACASGNQHKTIALCFTKFLQEHQYNAQYGFTALYGRANYKCVHPNAVCSASAAECRYNLRMSECEHSKNCPYMLQKARAVQSNSTVLNYAYWLTSKWLHKHPPQALYLDEAHNLSEIITDWVGYTVDEYTRNRWGLPAFPVISTQSTSSSMFASKFSAQSDTPTGKATQWLEQCCNILVHIQKRLQDNAENGNGKSAKKLHSCSHLLLRLQNVLSALQIHSTDWYIQSGQDTLYRRGNRTPGFVCKPLTAKCHFPYYFLGNDVRTIAMSATIGDVETFARELGISEYETHVVPSRFTPEQMPIYDLGCPGMGRKATPADFEEQASLIAKIIKAYDSGWSGLILVTRKAEAKLLTGRLAKYGLQDRLWVSPLNDHNGNGVGTDQQVRKWKMRLEKQPNSINITWSLWEGYDGLDEKILIVAKVPFPFLGNPFEKARMRFNGKMFHQRTGWKLGQGLGRTRRGRDEDYGPDSGCVAIADGNWRRIQKYLPAAIREAIVKW